MVMPSTSNSFCAGEPPSAACRHTADRFSLLGAVYTTLFPSAVHEGDVAPASDDNRENVPVAISYIQIVDLPASLIPTAILLPSGESRGCSNCRLSGDKGVTLPSR